MKARFDDIIQKFRDRDRSKIAELIDNHCEKSIIPFWLLMKSTLDMKEDNPNIDLTFKEAWEISFTYIEQKGQK